MSNPLRVAAFCVYIAAWLVFVMGAVVSAVPRIRRQTATSTRIDAASAIGALLQVASPIAITVSISDGPLRPTAFALACVLLIAPIAAGLFAGALLSASAAETLVTRGVCAWLRHPIYLAFLGMLVATGLLAANNVSLIIAVLFYLAGTELGIASEEKLLVSKFQSQYEQYRLRTRWRYLPRLR